jgi:hypothetical protein
VPEEINRARQVALSTDQFRQTEIAYVGAVVIIEKHIARL